MDKHNVTSPEQLLRQIKQRKFFLAARPWMCLFIVLLIVAAVIAGLAVLPYVQVYGTAMEPTLTDGDVGFTLPAKDYQAGDIIAFRQNGKVLTRRIIACSGSTVEIDESGIVKVDGVILEEPYVKQSALGQCSITFPYTVPDGRFFVMGDNRLDAVDSRSSTVGCIESDAIIGRVIVIFWPFSHFQWNPSEASPKIGGNL